MPLEDFDKAGHVMGRVCPCVWAWGQDEVGRGGVNVGFKKVKFQGSRLHPELKQTMADSCCFMILVKLPRYWQAGSMQGL